MQVEMIIRTASVRDTEELLAIYAPYVRKTAITFENDVPSHDEFEDRVRRVLERYPFLAAESNGEILGFAYAGKFKDRAAYDWAVETSVYVREDKRGDGIGRRLYEALECVLKEQGILNLNACIAYLKKEDEYLSNASTAFHKSMGYRIVGEFRKCGYKFGRWYDMIWMEKHIGRHLKRQPQVKAFSEIKEIVAEKYEIF